MLEVLKSKINERVAVWRQECKANGSTEIDIAEVFATMFSNNMIHIVFGEDLWGLKLDFNMMNADKTFEVKNVILGDVLNNLFPQLLAMVGKREEHPISVLAGMLFGIDLDFGPMAATVKANFAFVRQFIRGWVQGRRDHYNSGYNSSQINGADMLSLMFESPDIFDDDSIIDEACEFFVAVLRST